MHKVAKMQVSQGIEPNGGGALSSKNVSELGSKEVSKNSILSLRGSETTVALYQYPASYGSQVHLRCKPIAKSLHIDEITTSHFANAPRNDKTPTHPNLPLKREGTVRHAELVSASQMQERGTSSCNNKTLSRISKFTAFTKKFNPLPDVEGRVGFTLAEVLITLGIIGVVAALTIPVLHNMYQQKVIEVRFEKVYSELTNAFNAGAVENNEECFMQSWQMPYNIYVEHVYQNYLKPHIRMMDVATFGDLQKKYKSKNPEKAFWNWSQHIFIIDRRTFISFDSDAKTILVVLLNNDNFDFSNIKDGVNRFSLGTPFCCNNDKCASKSLCPNHNMKPIAAWANYSTEQLVELCKDGKDIAWQGGKLGFCTQALIQNGFKFPKGYPFK